MSSPKATAFTPQLALDGVTGSEPPGVALRRGAALDFAEVYAAHVQVAWRFLGSMGVRDADLEDLCQEVFLVVHRRLVEYDGRNPLKTWIYAICLRVASAHRRRAHMRHERVVGEPPERAVDATQTDDIAQAQARDVARRALDALDDDKRAVFVLFELEQVPMSEVAATLGCPVQTAYARLYAARRHVEAFVQHLGVRGGAT